MRAFSSQMRLRRLAETAFPAIVAIAMALNAHGGDVHAVNPHWNVGDSWTVDIELYSRDWAADFSDPKVEAKKNIPHILARYSMRIEVSGTESVDGTECWQLDFAPIRNSVSDDLEVLKDRRYRALVSKRSGSIQKVQILAGEDPAMPEIVHLDDTAVLLYPPYGFPIEMIPWGEESKGARALERTRRLALSRQPVVVDGKQKRYCQRVLDGDREVLRVEQTWNDGAKWWKEFTSYRDGHIDLHATLRPVGSQEAASLEEQVGALFQVGDSKKLSVSVPKEGFVGAPPSPAAMPSGYCGLPTKKEDFRTRRLRVEIIDKYPTVHGIRVVLRLDEIDPPPSLASAGPVYYACVEIRSSGAEIYGEDHLVKRDEEVARGTFAGAHRHGLPFPLLLTSIPGFTGDARFGLLAGGMIGDQITLYTQPKETPNTPPGMWVRATYLHRAPHGDLKGEQIRYYDPSEKSLSDTPGSNRVMACVVATEIQRWGDSPDWLWKEMERFDKDGTLTMRCKVEEDK
ncbi:MAG: hypothetical protein IT365_00770 [Candidatus Hydrogenedentes bacterium]|nr:hypothetical protein [Candidatus Hydrogenedentota bacterium]